MRQQNTKERIILNTLELGAQNGLDRSGLSEIAARTGIKKASLFNHFINREALIDALISYCRTLISKRDFSIDFKALGPVEMLLSLVEDLVSFFTTDPVRQYLSIVEEMKLTDQRFAEENQRITSMINARIQVVLEFCVQRSWLEISDTDVASALFCSSMRLNLSNMLMRERFSQEDNISDWELSRLVDGFASLFLHSVKERDPN